MDLRKIKKLIELVEESGIAELEVKSGDEAVRIARPVPGTGPVPGTAATIVQPAPAEQPAAPSQIPATDIPPLAVRAPMAGTFYTAAEPGAAPFVVVGDTVAVGDVLCIVESMKMMNEIRAEQAGTCRDVLVANGEPIGTGQALFHLAPAS